MTDAVLAVIILLPISATFFFKSNAAQAILALAAGYTVVSLVGTDINNGLVSIDLHSSKIWPQLQHIQSGIIGFAMLYALVLLWLGKRSRPHGKHKK
jgi:hypothetical protein